MTSWGLRKTYFFFHFKACERGNFDFYVFIRMCSGSVKNSLYHKLNGGSGRRHAGPHTPAGPTTHPLEQPKIKVSPLTDPQMEKKICFS